MPWSDLIDQQRVTMTLRRAIESDRVAHAYLFHGPDGVGKRATALEFAAALLCERASGDACGRCLACTKASRLIHPDLHVLFPEPKDTPVEEVRERLALLAQNPYAVTDFARRPSLADPAKTSNKQVQYHVARIHDDLIRPMSFRPVEGRYRIAVITDAHLLRTEAANAFLKLLEEPGSRTVFILTTPRPERLLSTIVSRCQKVRFDLLADEAIAEALVERAGADLTHATVVARMASGSFAYALDLLQEESVMEDRLRVVNFMRNAYGRKFEELSRMLDDMASMGRERVKTLLVLLQMWIRDLIRYRATGDESGITNVDQMKAITDFCSGVPDADLEGMVLLVEEAHGLVERNVSLPLLLVVLSERLRRAMHGQHGLRLYLPLAEPEPEAA
jgi:DNA polymerase III subunit delta'